MVDIASLVSGKRIIEINHPGTKQPIGIRIPVLSIDDERLLKVKRRITDRRLYLEARGKTFKAEEIDENRLDILFTAMDGSWEWYNPTGAKGDKGYDEDATPSFNGEIPEFTRRNFDAVLTRLPWIKDQINEAVGETEAFFNNSKSN